MRPCIGIEVWRNRLAVAGSIDSSAAIPRWDMARLMDRFSIAALDEARRTSKTDRTDH